MGSRLNLQTLLETLLQSDNVHYQPPSNIDMTYPAIKYSRRDIDNRFANDEVYSQMVGYEITVIDEYPDSSIVTAVSKLPTCKYDRDYKAENLNHTVFTIYY